MAVNINIDVKGSSELLDANRIQTASNRFVQQEKENKKAIEKKSAPIRQKNLESQKESYSTRSRIEPKAPSPKIEEPSASIFQDPLKIGFFGLDIEENRPTQGFEGIDYNVKIKIACPLANGIQEFTIPGPIDNHSWNRQYGHIFDDQELGGFSSSMYLELPLAEISHLLRQTFTFKKQYINIAASLGINLSRYYVVPDGNGNAYLIYHLNRIHKRLWHKVTDTQVATIQELSRTRLGASLSLYDQDPGECVVTEISYWTGDNPYPYARHGPYGDPFQVIVAATCSKEYFREAEVLHNFELLQNEVHCFFITDKKAVKISNIPSNLLSLAAKNNPAPNIRTIYYTDGSTSSIDYIDPEFMSTGNPFRYFYAIDKWTGDWDEVPSFPGYVCDIPDGLIRWNKGPLWTTDSAEIGYGGPNGQFYVNHKPPTYELEIPQKTSNEPNSDYDLSVLQYRLGGVSLTATSEIGYWGWMWGPTSGLNLLDGPFYLSDDQDNDYNYIENELFHVKPKYYVTQCPAPGICDESNYYFYKSKNRPNSTSEYLQLSNLTKMKKKYTIPEWFGARDETIGGDNMDAIKGLLGHVFHTNWGDPALCKRIVGRLGLPRPS